MKSQSHLMAAALLGMGLSAADPSTAQSASDPSSGSTQAGPALSHVHDFDFFVGHWRVHHRQLKERLANSHTWIEFEGTSTAQKLMGGFSNVDDNVIDKPDGSYRAVTLRSYDPKSDQWSIWWLDGRTPLGPLDPPVRGGFKNGVGAFYADDTFAGRPIRVRFLWSRITTNSCHWEQAFSEDHGVTWETNWEMELVRVP